jgi:hypothetical protein
MPDHSDPSKLGERRADFKPEFSMAGSSLIAAIALTVACDWTQRTKPIPTWLPSSLAICYRRPDLARDGSLRLSFTI